MGKVKMNCKYEIFYYPACKYVRLKNNLTDDICKDCSNDGTDTDCLTYLDMETDELV